MPLHVKRRGYEEGTSPAGLDDGLISHSDVLHAANICMKPERCGDIAERDTIPMNQVGVLNGEALRL
jgi:hypothetical protein